jgi:chloramphenicol-sensitive protein RarD
VTPPLTGATASRRAGVAAVLAAYLTWGLFGLYFKTLAAVPAPEVLAHRILGSLVVALPALILSGQMGEAMAVLRSWRRLRPLVASALAIAVNWGVFIFAVAGGRALEASMGYFLFPLVSILLGRILLGERLSRRQGVALGLVALGVGWLVARGGSVPWVALILASSFGLYGLLRKITPVSALAGLFVEAVVLAPFAALYLALIGGGVAPGLGASVLVPLAFAGPLTAGPLILFAFGARRLRLSTLGVMMYINPTVQMLVAVLALGESFDAAHGVAFAAIWAGLAVYSWPGAGEKESPAH